MSENNYIICTLASKGSLNGAVDGTTIESCARCGKDIMVSPSSSIAVKKEIGLECICIPCTSLWVGKQPDTPPQLAAFFEACHAQDWKTANKYLNMENVQAHLGMTRGAAKEFLHYLKQRK